MNKRMIIMMMMMFITYVSCSMAEQTKDMVYPVNWTSIEKFAKENPDSIKTLIRRISQQEADTLLTIEELELAYVGQTYLPEHKKAMAQYLAVRNALKKDDQKSVSRLVRNVLKYEPLNLYAVIKMVDLVYKELKNNSEHTKYSQKDLDYYVRIASMMMYAINSSGDGTSESPFSVISVDDEYIFMHEYLGIEVSRQYLIHGKVPRDDFDVKEKSKDYQNDKISFDITRVLQEEREMFKIPK